MSSIINAAGSAIYDALSVLPGPGRIAKLALVVLATPFASAAPTFTRRSVDPLVPSPSFSVLPHSLSRDGVRVCDNSTAVFSLGARVCDISGCCDTLPDPVGATAVSTLILEDGSGIKCDGLYWGQAYQDGSSNHIRVGRHTSTGFIPVDGTATVSGAHSVDISSLSMQPDASGQKKLYIGSSFSGSTGSTGSGYKIFRIFVKNDKTITLVGHDDHLSQNSTASATLPLVHTSPWENSQGGWLSIIHFSVNPSSSSKLEFGISSSIFGSKNSVSVDTSSTMLSTPVYAYLLNEKFLVSSVGDGSTIHLVLASMPAESKIPAVLDTTDISQGSVEHVAINPADEHGVCKLYWSSGGAVFVANVDTSSDVLVISQQSRLFDLGNITIDELSVGQFANRSQVIAFGVDGQTKVWVGDVVVPASTAPAPAATSSVPCQNLALVSLPSFVSGLYQYNSDGVVCDNDNFFMVSGPQLNNDHSVTVFNSSGLSLPPYNLQSSVVGNQAQYPIHFSHDHAASGVCSVPFSRTINEVDRNEWRVEVGELRLGGPSKGVVHIETDATVTELVVTSATKIGSYLYVGCRLVDSASGFKVYKFEDNGSSYSYVSESRFTRIGSSHWMDPILTAINVGPNPQLAICHVRSQPTNRYALRVLDLDLSQKEFFIVPSFDDVQLSNMNVRRLSDNSLLISYSGGDSITSQNILRYRQYGFINGTSSISLVGEASIPSPGLVCEASAWNNANDAFFQVWSDGGAVFLNHGKVGASALVTVESLGCLFDLSGQGSMVNHVQVGQFTNGKLAVGIGFADGSSKVWVGDVVVPEAISVLGPVETGEVLQTTGGAVETTDGAGRGGGMVVTAAPAVTGAVSGGPVIGGAQGGDGGSSMMGIVAGVVAGAVLLVFAAIVIVWRRRGHSEKKSLLNFNNSDIDRRQPGTASEKRMEAAAAVHKGMMSPGGMLGSGPPPAVPPRDDDEGLYERIREPEDPDYVDGVTAAQRLNRELNPDGERGDEGLYRNGGMLDGGGDQYRLSERDWRSAGGTHMSEPPPHQYDPVRRDDLRPRASSPADGEYRQPDDALPPELEETTDGLVDGQYANRDGVSDEQRAQMAAIAVRLRKDSETSNPLNVLASSGGGDTSSSGPESSTAGALQTPEWMQRRTSYHV